MDWFRTFLLAALIVGIGGMFLRDKMKPVVEAVWITIFIVLAVLAAMNFCPNGHIEWFIKIPICR